MCETASEPKIIKKRKVCGAVYWEFGYSTLAVIDHGEDEGDKRFEIAALSPMSNVVQREDMPGNRTAPCYFSGRNKAYAVFKSCLKNESAFQDVIRPWELKS
tara:strand:+ start:145 stop:450 length:306 start_codon:yes stop_codon:yes gene_type:complete